MILMVLIHHHVSQPLREVESLFFIPYMFFSIGYDIFEDFLPKLSKTRENYTKCTSLSDSSLLFIFYIIFWYIFSSLFAKLLRLLQLCFFNNYFIVQWISSFSKSQTKSDIPYQLLFSVHFPQPKILLRLQTRCCFTLLISPNFQYILGNFENIVMTFNIKLKQLCKSNR